MKATAHTLLIYTVYCRPDDYPDSFVVRRAVVGPGVAVPDVVPLCVADTLEEVRAVLPEGLYRLERDPFDPPAIVEMWL